MVMPLYKTIQSFFIGEQELQLMVPDTAAPLQSVYSPYWGKVWPAAVGLCTFLQNNLQYIQQKKVAEIAAGLGLPSIFAARYAAELYCSDIEPTAMEYVKKSAVHSGLANLHCRAAGWNEMDAAAKPDVVLLSDVNYEPAQFDELLQVIENYLKQRCTVILSTPQRLMAKPFVEKLLHYCVQQEELMVMDKGVQTAVSVLVLRNKNL